MSLEGQPHHAATTGQMSFASYMFVSTIKSLVAALEDKNNAPLEDQNQADVEGNNKAKKGKRKETASDTPPTGGDVWRQEEPSSSTQKVPPPKRKRTTKKVSTFFLHPTHKPTC